MTRHGLEQALFQAAGAGCELGFGRGTEGDLETDSCEPVVTGWAGVFKPGGAQDQGRNGTQFDAETGSAEILSVVVEGCQQSQIQMAIQAGDEGHGFGIPTFLGSFEEVGGGVACCRAGAVGLVPMDIHIGDVRAIWKGADGVTVSFG